MNLDPYLNGEAAYETIMGVQSQGVQACVKHFIGYQQVGHPALFLDPVVERRRPDKVKIALTYDLLFFPYTGTIQVCLNHQDG